MVVAPTVENASEVVVGPAVAAAWAMADPAVVVGVLPARGPVSGLGADAVAKVVGASGPVVGVDTDLGAGSAGTVGSARAGARRGGDGWGSRVAEATRAARTPVVSPKATSPSRQGHRDLGRCRGGGVDMVHVPVRRQGKADGLLPRSVAWSYPVTPLAAFALSGAFDKWGAINAPNPGQPRHAAHAKHAGMDTLGPAGRWSWLGPRLVHNPSEPSGSQRSPAVSSGTSFAQVAGAILRKQAQGQNPDKDELRAVRRRRELFGAGCDQRASATIPRSSGWWDRLARSLRVARSARRRSPRP
jgi:hypothetical protein